MPDETQEQSNQAQAHTGADRRHQETRRSNESARRRPLEKARKAIVTTIRKTIDGQREAIESASPIWQAFWQQAQEKKERTAARV